MRRRLPGGVTLTTRGAGMAVGAVALLVASVVVGIAELTTLAVADLVVLAGSITWVATRRWSIAMRRTLHPHRIETGRAARVELAVRNDWQGRSPSLELHDPLDGRGGATLRLAPMTPGRVERGEYDLGRLPRGRHLVGPLEVTLGDPFGLVRSTRRVGSQSVLHVHPPVEELLDLPPAPGDRSASNRGLAPTPAGDELHALRPYREGDDLRRVHWPATARVGELVIRQDEAAAEGRVEVAVDLRAAAWDAASLDTALSAAASICLVAVRHGVVVRLRTTAGADTGWLAPERADVVLDILAAAAPHSGAGRPLSGLGDGGAAGAVVVTSDAVDAPALGPSARAGGGLPTLVVIERSGGRRRPGEVRVRPGGRLAPAWGAAFGPAAPGTRRWAG